MSAYLEKLRVRENEFPILCLYNRNQQYYMEVHPHWHEYIEILVLEEGEAQIQIDSETFYANSGDVIIISAEKIHAVYSYNLNTVFKVMIIDPEFLFNSNYSFCQNMKKAIAYSIKYPNAISKGDSIYDSLISLYNKIFFAKKTIEDDGLKVMVELMKMMDLIYTEYKDRFTKRDVILSKRARGALLKLFDYIDSFYMEQITLEEAANIVGYSQAQLSRLMRQATNLSFQSYLNRYRVRMSVKLIIEGQSYTQSAYQVGFGSFTSFHRAFKKWYRVSPKEYFTTINKM